MWSTSELRCLVRADHHGVEPAGPPRHVARDDLTQRALVEDRELHLDVGPAGEQRRREMREVLRVGVSTTATLMDPPPFDAARLWSSSPQPATAVVASPRATATNRRPHAPS